jgi:hypothetical protein
MGPANEKRESFIEAFSNGLLPYIVTEDLDFVKAAILAMTTLDPPPFSTSPTRAATRCC